MHKKLIKLFFPDVCAGCSGMLTENEKMICVVCRHEIPLTNHLLYKENESFKKFFGRIPLEHLSSMAYYFKKGIVQNLIYNLKYKNHQEIGTLLGNWYAEDLKEIEILKTIDYIIPVPLHPKRLKERGYNQVTTFCKALSSGLDLPFEENILVRKLYSITQSKKNLTNRNFVSNQTFEVVFTENHFSKHFLLVDDVLTTGATLEACSKELLKINGAKISIVTIAVAQN
jgi:ComF family protein